MLTKKKNPTYVLTEKKSYLNVNQKKNPTYMLTKTKILRKR